MAEQKGDENKVSFAFSKKKMPTVLEKKICSPSIVEESNKETDFVLALEKREIKSTKQKEKLMPLVIPLIKRNAYGSKQPDEGKTTEDGPEILKTCADNLNDDAIREIIKGNLRD
jgi:hypothetical protein